MMKNRIIKSAIILIDNLLDNPKKYGRQSFAERLKQEGLPASDATITRLLDFINEQIGIAIEVDRSKFVYTIDYEESSSDFLEKYYQYKNLYFRNILQQTTLENDIVNHYISSSFSTQNKNIEFVNPLLTAILENRKVQLEYLPFYQDAPSTWVVCPLFIKEYLNRWYLITEKIEGRHPVFAIDRIQHYEILKSRFKRTNEINDTVFRNTIGVNFSDPIEKVRLWVSKQQYPYFETLPFHISQKTEKEVADGFIISFEVTLNFELKQWILFFGNSIKVLKPRHFKRQIVKELKMNLKQYKR